MRRLLTTALISMLMIGAAEMPDPAGRTLAGQVALIDGARQTPVAVITAEFAAGSGACARPPPGPGLPAEPCRAPAWANYLTLYRDPGGGWLLRRTRGEWSQAGEWDSGLMAAWASSRWCPRLNALATSLATLTPGKPGVVFQDGPSFLGVTFDPAFNPRSDGDWKAPLLSWQSSADSAVHECWSPDPSKPPAPAGIASSPLAR